MKKENSPKITTKTKEKDSTFLLKIIVYIILGGTWLRFSESIDLWGLVITGLPIGLFIGLLFAAHEHFQIDRKIEFVVLIFATILSVFLPTGIVI